MNVLVCTPCYQGNVEVEYMKSVQALQKVFDTMHIKYDMFMPASESLIPRGRNACVAYFLSRTEFTHLLFIDADIKFDPQTVIRLLNSNFDFCGAPYPKKNYDFDKMAKDINKLIEAVRNPDKVKELTATDLTLVEGRTLPLKYMDYVFNVSTTTTKERKTIEGFLNIDELGTGFMLLKRKVFDVLKAKYPDMIYNNDVGGYNSMHPNMKDNFYLFFDCRLDHHRRYLSEDYAFCKLWRDAGGEIWIDLTATTYHIGKHHFLGNQCATWKLNGKIA